MSDNKKCKYCNKDAIFNRQDEQLCGKHFEEILMHKITDLKIEIKLCQEENIKLIDCCDLFVKKLKSYEEPRQLITEINLN